MDSKQLQDIRREYGALSFEEKDLAPNPFAQFAKWFDEIVLCEKNDPTTMVLSTVDNQGHPDARVVLLKGIENDQFIFYTNYESTKAIQLSSHPFCALTFYWPILSRQVRVRGHVQKLDTKKSDLYFASRPLKSQYSAMISHQSKIIPDRKNLEDKLNALIAAHGQKPLLRPKHWGGYAVKATEVEFWQGRDNRLHDRFLFQLSDAGWIYHRLAP